MSPLTRILLVGSGGFFGAIARYVVSGLVQRAAGDRFPWGTLAVNAAGCLFIGLIMGFVQDGVLFGPRARLFLTVGLLGSLTTFSTFGYETLELIREHDAIRAAANAAANLLLGLGAVLCGRALARWWLG